MTDAFRTDFNIPKASYTLSGQSRVLTMGSCFSDMIGHKLQQYKVQTLVNPFGTIFNPVSAGQLLEAAAGQDIDIENRLVERDGLWYAYDLHSSFAAATPVALLTEIQKSIAETAEFLKQTDLLILTFGTAIAYKLKETGEVVANCHKLPAALFDREMLTPDEIVTAMFSMHAAIKSVNPNLKIVLTVSPVRHVKETLVVNSASKAALRVACHYLSETLPDVNYFPSFELMMDDLRDYRFYKADMLHPTEVAENYIWQKFTHAYFDEAFRKFMPEWDRIKRALSHKPFQPESPGHQRFLKDLLLQLESLNQQMDCSLEIKAVREQLITEPEAPAGKHKKKKKKPAREDRAIPDQPVVTEAPEIIPETAEPELVTASPADVPAFSEPAPEPTPTAATEPENIEPAPVPAAPEKPALTEAELEAIANRPIVPAKPWMSAKEKAEARKREREAQQAAKRENKKKKHKQKKAAGLVNLLTGIKSVAEFKPAEPENIAPEENKPEQPPTTLQSEETSLPVSTPAPFSKKAKKSAGKQVTKAQPNATALQPEKPVAEEKNLAISAFLQNLAAPKPAAAPDKPKKQPARRKSKPFAKNQPKTEVNKKAETIAPETTQPVAEPIMPVPVPAPEFAPAKPAVKKPASKRKTKAAKPVPAKQAAQVPDSVAETPKAPEKPKRNAPVRQKQVAASEPAAVPDVKKAQPKKPANRKKGAETAEKPKAKTRTKGKKEPKSE